MSAANLQLLMALGLSLAATSCASRRPAGSSEQAVPAGTEAVMSDHFVASLEIKDAVIRGDLVGVRAPALRLGEAPDSYPTTWRPYVALHGQLAAAARDAADLRDAARVAAELANTCGECHVATGHGPRFSIGIPPRSASEGEGRRRMIRHEWAADRMWEGLVSHDDAAWVAGAAALSGAPLSRQELGVRATVPDTTLELQAHIVELGEEAATAATWGARSRLYGDFLASCAGCHARAS